MHFRESAEDIPDPELHGMALRGMLVVQLTTNKEKIESK